MEIVENGNGNSQEWKYKRSRMEVIKYGSVMALLGHRRFARCLLAPSLRNSLPIRNCSIKLVISVHYDPLG